MLCDLRQKGQNVSHAVSRHKQEGSQRELYNGLSSAFVSETDVRSELKFQWQCRCGPGRPPSYASLPQFTTIKSKDAAGLPQDMVDEPRVNLTQGQAQSRVHLSEVVKPTKEENGLSLRFPRCFCLFNKDDSPTCFPSKLLLFCCLNYAVVAGVICRLEPSTENPPK